MYTLLLEINLSTLLYHPLSSFLDTSRHEDNKNKMKGEKNMDAKSEINSRVVHDERGGARWRKGTRVPRGRHMWIVTSQRNAGNVRLVATDAASMHKREPARIPRHRHAAPRHAVYTPCVVASRTYVRTYVGPRWGVYGARLPVLSAGTDNRLLPGIQVWVGRSAITFNRAGPFIIAVGYSMDRRTMTTSHSSLPDFRSRF